MKTFTQTSDKPYDRQWYKVGEHVVDNWYDATQLWAALKQPIEVLDKPKRGGGGF